MGKSIDELISVLLDFLFKVEHNSFFGFELKHRLMQPTHAFFMCVFYSYHSSEVNNQRVL